MPGQTQMIGNTSGPTPWWQTPGQGANLNNLQSSAPTGYQYNPVTQDYEHTPTAIGANAATTMNAFLNGNQALQGLTGAPGAAGTPGGGGTGVASVGGGVAPGGSPGGGISGGANIAAIAPPDSSAATNAAFAGAKDQAGQLSRASLTSLNDELGASGMVGSGAQVQGTRDIIQSGAGQVGQASRDLAGKKADQAADFAKTTYQGELTQRGQNIQAQQAQAQLALQTNNANWQHQMQQQQMLMSILSGLGGVKS